MAQEKAVTKVDALPTSLEEVRGMAEAFVKSGMFSDTKQLAQAIVKIQAGRELGLPPVYSMQNINLIRDRLTTSAGTIAMLVKRSGKYNYRIGSHTDAECKIEFFEDGKTVGWSNFTMEDAKRANLVKPDSGWVKFPRAMLFSRAISQGARMYAPDAIGGVYTDEEIRSIPPRPEDAKEITEPLAEPEPISQPLQPKTSPVEQASSIIPPDSPLDLDWLKENLTKAHFPEKTCISWLKSKANYRGLDLTGSLEDIIKRMNPEQANFLESEIKSRLELA